MKNLILIMLGVVFLTSCTTSTKILTKPEPQFEGISNLLKGQQTLKIFMIHGIGETPRNYADKFVEKLEENGFNLKSRAGPKNVYTATITINPTTNKCPNSCEFDATANVTTYYFSKGDKNLNLYSFNWDNINHGLQQYLLHGIYKINGHDLENEMVKLNKFIRKTLDTKISDVVAYANPQLKEVIQNATIKGICEMHNDTKTAIATSEASTQSANLLSVKSFTSICGESTQNENDKYVFISISLGSQILIDTLLEIYKKAEENKNMEYKNIVENTADEFYMLANQIPLTDAMNLDIKTKTATIANSTKALIAINTGADSFSSKVSKLYELSHPEEKSKEKLKIVSFIAPNDFLSYPLTNINTENVEFINIQIGNSTKWLGLLTVPIDGGHGIEYLDNSDVANFIINGDSTK